MGLMTLCTVVLAACGDDESYDFPGDAYNRVYIQNNSGSYKIVQTPISTISNMEFKVPLKCTQKTSGEVKATMSVDNSLIDAYNDEHGTNFDAMPTAAVKMENATMTIPAGGMITKDSICVTLTEDESVLSTLKSENGYLIPLKISETVGGSSQASTNMYTAYLTVTVTEDNMNHDATEYAGTGALVADQSAWVATTNGSVLSYYDPISAIFDGDYETYCYISNRSGELQLDVDMGKPCSFDAIKMTCAGYDYSTWEYMETGAFTSGMTISTSDNGTDWKSQGGVDRDTPVCVFYAPLTARYIRISVPNAGGWYGATLQCGIFNVYAK